MAYLRRVLLLFRYPPIRLTMMPCVFHSGNDRRLDMDDGVATHWDLRGEDYSIHLAIEGGTGHPNEV